MSGLQIKEGTRSMSFKQIKGSNSANQWRIQRQFGELLKPPMESRLFSFSWDNIGKINKTTPLVYLNPISLIP